MAVDKNKIIAEATRLVQKGAFEKAIRTYEKILVEDPKDVRVLLKVGELYQKKGDDRLAADAFKRVAETYADQGFFLKSVAVYKQIVKLDPEDVRVNERLAALYQQLGLMSDAMVQYQLMAASYEKVGDGAHLLDVLRRMVELDPENIASSIKLGELYQRASQAPQALEAFRRAADYLKRHSRADEYLRVAERIAALAPDDLGLTRELANLYLAKGDTKRALAKLQLCFKADPKDVETLNLLAQAFKELGQTAKTLSVYKELARVHEERGRSTDARSAWRKVADLAPDDPEAQAKLGVASPPPPSPAPSPAPAPERVAARPAARPEPRPPEPPRPAPPPPAVIGPEAIPKLLTETDVYLKYGLLDKALDHLRRVLAIDPQAPEAHEKARDIHLSAGRMAEAARSGEAAVRGALARGDADRAREAFGRLRQLAPGHPALGELGGAVGSTEEIQLDAAEVEEEEVAPELVLAGEVALEEPLPLEPEPEVAGSDALALSAAGELDEAVLDDEPMELGPPAGARPAPVREVLLEAELEPMAAAPSDDDLAAAAAVAAAESPEEIVDEPMASPPPVVLAAPLDLPDLPAPEAEAEAEAEVAGEGEEEAVDLSDELEEADFFLQQGLVDEAREALRNLAAFYPDHLGVSGRLAELERRAAPPPAPRAPAPPPVAPAPRPAPAPLGAHTELGTVKESPSLVSAAAAGGESFDIAAELAEELDGGAGGAAALPADEFQYSVEDVFNQFKKGVAETVKAEDSDTHYDLGIAYKEMGLLDDAVHEFETAIRGTNRKKEVDCLSMVGLCRMTQGRPRDAVEALRRALRSDYLSKEASKSIHFDLATAYEAADEPQVALWYFQKVVRAEPGYRQVAARVASLGGGPGRPPADDPSSRSIPRPASGAGPTAGAAAAPARPGVKKNIGYL